MNTDLLLKAVDPSTINNLENKSYLVYYQGRWAIRYVEYDASIGYYVQPLTKGFPVINVLHIDKMYAVPED